MKKTHEDLWGTGEDFIGFGAIGKDTDEGFKSLNEVLSETEWIRSTVLLNGASGDVNYKRKNGLIRLLGVIRLGGSDRITSARIVFNLPAQFAPERDVWFSGTAAPGSTNYPENNAIVLSVATNGQFIAQRATTGSVDFRFDITYFSK